MTTHPSIFADDLDGENVESVVAAFDLHRKRTTRFPTPAHIIALLPECRVLPARRVAIPQATEGKKTKGMGRLAYAAYKGDKAAKAALDRPIAKTCRAMSA